MGIDKPIRGAPRTTTLKGQSIVSWLHFRLFPLSVPATPLVSEGVAVGVAASTAVQPEGVGTVHYKVVPGEEAVEKRKYVSHVTTPGADSIARQKSLTDHNTESHHRCKTPLICSGAKTIAASINSSFCCGDR